MCILQCVFTTPSQVSSITIWVPLPSSSTLPSLPFPLVIIILKSMFMSLYCYFLFLCLIPSLFHPASKPFPAFFFKKTESPDDSYAYYRLNTAALRHKADWSFGEKRKQYFHQLILAAAVLCLVVRYYCYSCNTKSSRISLYVGLPGYRWDFTNCHQV